MSGLHTNECWLGYHDYCTNDFGSCGCLCHLVFDWDESADWEGK